MPTNNNYDPRSGQAGGNYRPPARQNNGGFGSNNSNMSVGGGGFGGVGTQGSFGAGGHNANQGWGNLPQNQGGVWGSDPSLIPPGGSNGIQGGMPGTPGAPPMSEDGGFGGWMAQNGLEDQGGGTPTWEERFGRPRTYGGVEGLSGLGLDHPYDPASDPSSMAFDPAYQATMNGGGGGMGNGGGGGFGGGNGGFGGGNGGPGGTGNGGPGGPGGSTPGAPPSGGGNNGGLNRPWWMDPGTPGGYDDQGRYRAGPSSGGQQSGGSNGFPPSYTGPVAGGANGGRGQGAQQWQDMQNSTTYGPVIPVGGQQQSGWQQPQSTYNPGFTQQGGQQQGGQQGGNPWNNQGKPPAPRPPQNQTRPAASSGGTRPDQINGGPPKQGGGADFGQGIAGGRGANGAAQQQINNGMAPPPGMGGNVSSRIYERPEDKARREAGGGQQGGNPWNNQGKPPGPPQQGGQPKPSQNPFETYEGPMTYNRGPDNMGGMTQDSTRGRGNDTIYGGGMGFEGGGGQGSQQWYNQFGGGAGDANDMRTWSPQEISKYNASQPKYPSGPGGGMGFEGGGGAGGRMKRPEGTGYPEAWGQPPQYVTMDLVPDPRGGGGMTNSTTAGWIRRNQQEHGDGDPGGGLTFEGPGDRGNSPPRGDGGYDPSGRTGGGFQAPPNQQPNRPPLGPWSHYNEDGNIVFTCFVVGTPISTPDGETAIETIEVGDTVVAYDHDEGSEVESLVTDVLVSDAKDTFKVQVGGDTLEVTGEHPFWSVTAQTYVPVKDLSVGDQVLLRNLGNQPIDSIVPKSQATAVPVYNITVEGQHNYFAGNVLVHNKSVQQGFKPTVTRPDGTPVKPGGQGPGTRPIPGHNGGPGGAPAGSGGGNPFESPPWQQQIGPDGVPIERGDPAGGPGNTTRPFDPYPGSQPSGPGPDGSPGHGGGSYPQRPGGGNPYQTPGWNPGGGGANPETGNPYPGYNPDGSTGPGGSHPPNTRPPNRPYDDHYLGPPSQVGPDGLHDSPGGGDDPIYFEGPGGSGIPGTGGYIPPQRGDNDGPIYFEGRGDPGDGSSYGPGGVNHPDYMGPPQQVGDQRSQAELMARTQEEAMEAAMAQERAGQGEYRQPYWPSQPKQNPFESYNIYW